jgi:hypothetical protein
MLQLSISSTPDLQTLKAAAGSMFSSSAGTVQQQQQQQQQQGVDTQPLQPQAQGFGRPGSSSSNLQQQLVYGHVAAAGASQQQQQQQQRQQQQHQQRPGMESVVLAGVGQLGPLGTYLLSRWREDVARSAAAAAQGVV